MPIKSRRRIRIRNVHLGPFVRKYNTPEGARYKIDVEGQGGTKHVAKSVYVFSIHLTDEQFMRLYNRMGGIWK
jgi:hypothetical protein